MLMLLERAEASVHLDARRPGVLLPPHLSGEPHVRLDYGYALQPSIPDLEVGDEGIRATLSFNRTPFATFVPWTSVYLIADFDGNGAVWQEDIPGDMLEGMAEREPPKPMPEPADKPKPRPSHLKLVK